MEKDWYRGDGASGADDAVDLRGEFVGVGSSYGAGGGG